MTDKYTLQLINEGKKDMHYELYERIVPEHDIFDMPLAKIYCTQEIANLIDKALNQTSRAGSVTSQAKRDASKRNIAKRWKK